MVEKKSLEEIIQGLIDNNKYWSIHQNTKTKIPIIVATDPKDIPDIEKKGLQKPVSLYTQTFIPNALKKWENVCNIEITKEQIENQNKCFIVNTESPRHQDFYIHSDPPHDQKPVYLVYKQSFFQSYGNFLVQQKWSTIDPKTNKPSQVIYDRCFYGLINITTLINTGLILNLIYSDNVKQGNKTGPLYDQHTNQYTIFSNYLPQAYSAVNLLHYSIHIRTPLLHDIAAMQYTYGLNTSYNTENTTYKFSKEKPFIECIWDAAGNDMIDLSNQKLGAKIDLRGGDNFSSVGTFIGDEQKQAVHNLTIAHGATIENALLSRHNDNVTLNWANNVVFDLGGQDKYHIFDKHLVTSIEQGKVKQEWKQGSGHNIVKDNTGNNFFVFYFSKKQNTLHFTMNKKTGTLFIQDKQNLTNLEIQNYSKEKHLLAFQFYDEKYLDHKNLEPGQSFDKTKISRPAILPDRFDIFIKHSKSITINQMSNRKVAFDIAQ